MARRRDHQILQRQRQMQQRKGNHTREQHGKTGGQKGKATADHLLILNTIKQHKKNPKKDLHIAFLDVTKHTIKHG